MKFLLPVATVAILLIAAAPALAIDLFTDVGAQHRFYGDIQALASRGSISGFEDGTFRPDDLVTRQQMAKILVLVEEAHTTAIDNAQNPSFPDVPLAAGTPYPFDYVEECAENGWFVGDGSGYFRPLANITRAQLALVLVRAGGEGLQQPPADYSTGFTDIANLDVETRLAIAIAKFNGLLDGKTLTIFDPYGNATRGHVSKMAQNLVEKTAEGAVVETAATPSADLSAIAARVSAILALGYNTTNADVVAKQLFDNNPANDPFILDTREAVDFAKGHIPGAVNIPLKELPRALLAGDERIPLDREIIIASYWGNDGNMANVVVNLYRITDPVAQKAAIDAKTQPPYPKSTTLFQGMTTWSFERDLVPENTRFEDAQKAGIVVSKPVEAGTFTGTDQGAFPAFRAFAEDDIVYKTLVRAREYFDSFTTQFDMHVYPSDLAAELEDGDTSNDPIVLSVRGAAHYDQGHIPGAVNVPYQGVANLATYTKFLDPDKPIVAYCYTGHTGSISTMALGILGYHARNLLYGMNGWSMAAPASGQLSNFDLMRTWEFPVNDGGVGDLDSLGEYVPPSGCEGCHSSLAALFYDREVVNPPQTAIAPPNEGEG